MTCKTWKRKRYISQREIIEKRRELSGVDFVAYVILVELLPHDGSWRRLTTEALIGYTSYTGKVTMGRALQRLEKSGHIKRQREREGQPYSYKLLWGDR